MKLSHLLLQRDALLVQTRLANFAFAYVKLQEYAARIDRAGLTGIVNLKHPPNGNETAPTTLTALSGQQSVLEEHFTDEDVCDLADVIGFILGGGGLDLTFTLEDLADTFLGPLRREFEEHGIEIDDAARIGNLNPEL